MKQGIWVDAKVFAEAMAIPETGVSQSELMLGKDESGNEIPFVAFSAGHGRVKYPENVTEVFVEDQDRNRGYLKTPL
ncbi:hypothetical protein [Marinobacter sp.]|uniref:hypothetical protein n=1 Tax=Marinobacter sp. TaxID=50741 RepID=UPI003A8D7911